MSTAFDNRIQKVTPNAEDFSVRLLWENGSETITEFGHMVGHGVFAPMSDPAFFNQVSLKDNGQSLTWPNEVDICADSLWLGAHPEALLTVLLPYQPPKSRVASPVSP